MNTIYTNHFVIEKPGDLVKALDEPTLANYERLKTYLRVYGYKLSDLSRKLMEVKKRTSLYHDYTVNSVYNLRVAIINDWIGNDAVYQWHDALEVAEIMTLKQPTETKRASKRIVKVKIRRSKMSETINPIVPNKPTEEKTGVQYDVNDWYERAKKITTLDEFNQFFNDIFTSGKYCITYDSICHALAALSIAAFHLGDNSPIGGITGFQASHVMWMIISREFIRNNKTGLRLINYDKLMYPQYVDSTCLDSKLLSKDVHESLITECKNMIAEKSRYASDTVVDHWKKIAEGWLPDGYRVEEDEND